MDEKQNSGLLYSTEYIITIHFKLIFTKTLCLIGVCTFTELPKSVSLTDNNKSTMAEIQAARKKKTKGKCQKYLRQIIMDFNSLHTDFVAQWCRPLFRGWRRQKCQHCLLEQPPAARPCGHPNATLTPEQSSHSYCYSDDECGSENTQFWQKADYMEPQCFLLCLLISQNGMKERYQGWLQTKKSKQLL